MISAFRAVFGSLFHATRNFRRKNYFNKVVNVLHQNNFLANLFHTTRHPKRSGATHVDTLGLPSIRHPEALAEGATHVGMFDKNRCAAFTLAEVLITLGIIGIVAALTIPTLVKNYEKFVLETKFKKAKSVLFQTIKLWQIDENNILTNPYHFNDDIVLRDYLLKYLKGNIVQTPAELKPYFTSIKNSTTEIHYCPVSCCLHPLYNNRMIETSDGIMYGACARDNVNTFLF